MLTVRIPAREIFDEQTLCFRRTKAAALTLEHSLISISKWEAQWRKPFFSFEPKTDEELFSYIRCMSLSPNVDSVTVRMMPMETLREITEYIDAPMTATTVCTEQNGGGREIVTSELIYYWMIMLGIPFECEKWHFNRLITLIRVCSEKNKPPKRQSVRQRYTNQAALNAARRAHYHTMG